MSRTTATPREILTKLEFSYPPADAIVSTRDGWRLAARCPICFAEFTLERAHNPGCTLKAALQL